MMALTYRPCNQVETGSQHLTATRTNKCTSYIDLPVSAEWVQLVHLDVCHK